MSIQPCLAVLLLLGASVCPALLADDSPPPAVAMQTHPDGCIGVDSSEAERAAIGERIYEQMVLPAVMLAQPDSLQKTEHYFAPDLQTLAQKNIFESIWGRCGLSRHDRSLVTLGILIALRADNELRYHFPIAMANGLSRRELEEVIYHAASYTGMPAAVSARIVAQDVLPKPK